MHLQFTVRYLLDTDIYKELSKLGVKIIILSPNGNEKNFINKYKLKNVRFELLELNKYTKFKKNLTYKFFTQVRRFTLHSLNDISTILLKEKLFFEQIKHYKLSKKLFYLFCIYSSRLARINKTFRDLLLYLENKIYKTNYHSELYKKYNPDAIITNDLGTIESSNFIMREARNNNVKIFSLILSWDNLTAKGIGALIPDYAVAWNKIMANELINNHNLKPKNVYIGGIPQFDRYHNKNINNLNNLSSILGFSKPFNKLIYFGTGAPGWFKENYRVIKIIIKIIKEELKHENIKLIVRPHPSYFVRNKFYNEIEKMEDLVSKNKNLIYLNKPDFIARDNGFEFTENDQNLHQMFLTKSDILITSYSTLMLEATIFNKPIINIGFDSLRGFPKKSTEISKMFTHLIRVLKNGFAPIAEKEKDLYELIRKYIKNPKIHSKERNEIFNNYINYNFGSSGKAIANHIYNVLYK